MKRSAVLFGAFLAVVALETRAAVVLNDGDFTAWVFGSIGQTANASREATGGNPGARMTITTDSASGTAYGYGFKSDYATNVPLEGTAYTLTVDVQGATLLQALELIVEQGGTVYRKGIGDTGTRATYTTLVFPGTLTAASFTKLAGPGPAQPVLTGGTATRFGIAGGNTFSSVIVFRYDNVRLDLAAVAGTDPCAGFSDIASDESFCQATIWLKNRGITTGCTATQYCPGQTVTRAQMALFLNRLGRALAPEVLHDARLHQGANPAPNPPGTLVCETQDFPTGDYARTANFYGSFAGYPNLQTVALQGYYRYSTDSGATWNYVGNWMVNQFPTADVANPGEVANGMVNAPPLNLAVNTSYRFGLFVDGRGAQPGFALIQCNLQVTILTPP